MMNQGAPTWNMESNLPLLETQKRSMGVNNELVELLWRNGQVVKNNQTHRKIAETRQKGKYDHALSDGESFMDLSSLVEEDVTTSWMQCPLDDPLGGDFLSSLFFELPNSHPVEKDKAFKHFGALEEANVLDANSAIRLQQPVFRQPNNSNLEETLVRSTHIPSSTQGPSFENFPHFSRPSKAELGSSNAPIRGSGLGLGLVAGGDIGESSVMTIGSSDCGSNQIPYKVNRNGVSSNRLGSGGIKENGGNRFVQCERGLTETHETTITSSSGGSGGSYTEAEKQSISIKRKGRDANESELQSEGADFESAGATKAPRQSGSRRSRAAEVHNLSERRRRDRINEKMKALQELIPHCNKSDKASMLDEAIEYLKSLQLQVQMMWMGGGVTPMMLPGIQNYISRMTMGVGAHQALPPIHSPMQLPRVPLVNRSMSSTPFSNQPTMCPSVLGSVNFQNRMQNPNFSLPYMGFHQMQTPQPMNMYGYGTQISQQGSKIGLNSRTITENTPSAK